MKSLILSSDLHFHSTYSDGSATLDEIFQQASTKICSVMALTDHDTVLGIGKEVELAKKFHIPIISGIELTAYEEGLKFHVLGYNIDYKSPELIAYSKAFLEQANERSKRQLKKMQEDGIRITEEELFQFAGGGPLYRGKFLGALAKCGYLKETNIMELIPKYFGKGAPYYEVDDYNYPNFNRVIRLIHDNGGVVVLAHPEKIKQKNEELYKCLLQHPCIDGVEVYHPSNGEKVREELLMLAKKRDLMITGGSDYHGIYNKKCTPLFGEEIPEYVYHNVKHLIHN